MAAKKSYCIDYSGKRVLKVLPQSINAKSLVIDLLRLNKLKILNQTDYNGFTQFKCIEKHSNTRITLNIFFSNFKFDIQRPNFININLGTKIASPYELSTKDNLTTKTLILGIYVFDRLDTIDKILFVMCPIKDRNYNKNPSLRPHIDLIQKSRLHSDAIWTNAAGDNFRAFQPLAFSNVINFSNFGKSFPLSENQTFFIKKQNKPGPVPSSKSYVVNKKDTDKNAVVYVARWGLTNLWKIGTTTNIVRRLREFNEYIPSYEFNDQPIWTFILAKDFLTKKKAYDVEQKILNDPSLKKYNTSGERFKCHFSLIKNVINTHCSN